MAVAFPNHWQTPEEVLSFLNAPYQDALTQCVPADLATLISEYATYQIEQNGVNWHKALHKINALPKKIPPLRPDIRQILESPCPIFGPEKTVAQTHSLWLIPAGEVEDGSILNVEDLANLCEIPHFMFFNNTGNPQHTHFKISEWILILDKLVPGSEKKTYKHNKRVIQCLRIESGVHYELPLLKHAVGTNLLKLQIDDTGLWRKGNNTQRTRVQESFKIDGFSYTIGGLPYRKCHHVIGWKTLHIGWCYNNDAMHADIGITVVRRDLTVPPPTVPHKTRLARFASRFFKSSNVT